MDAPGIGYVYRYTHKETGKYYIGSHNGTKSSKYTGSGKIWKNALKKYGISSFNYEILYLGDDYRDVEEKMLIELDAANDPLSYNLKNKAIGYPAGVSYEEMYGEERGKALKEHQRKIRIGKPTPMAGLRPWNEGLRASEETRKKQSLAKIGKPSWNKGKKMSEEFRQMRHDLTVGKPAHNKGVKQKIISCPHCGKTGGISGIKHYHFDKCKFKDNI